MAFHKDQTKRKPNLVLSVMVLVNLVLLVLALGCAPVMIVVSGKPFESPRKPTHRTSELQGWFVSKERGGLSTHSTRSQHPKKTQQNKPGGIKSEHLRFKS